MSLSKEYVFQNEVSNETLDDVTSLLGSVEASLLCWSACGEQGVIIEVKVLILYTDYFV